jgi:hypothetical protein
MMMADIVIVVMGIMTMIGMVKIQNNVREQHVLVMVVAAYAAYHVLHAGDGAGHGSLGKDEQEADAKHRPSSPEPWAVPDFHALKLASRWLASNMGAATHSNSAISCNPYRRAIRQAA